MIESAGPQSRDVLPDLWDERAVRGWRGPCISRSDMLAVDA